MVETKCGFNSIPGGASGQELLVAYGPTLPVDIVFDPTFVGSPHPPPAPGIGTVHALVDTGATESCIDSLLATQLNLPIVDRRPISGIHGPHIANMHLAQVIVPALNCWIYGVFAAVDLAAGGQVHRALIV